MTEGKCPCNPCVERDNKRNLNHEMESSNKSKQFLAKSMNTKNIFRKKGIEIQKKWDVITTDNPRNSFITFLTRGSQI